MPFEEESRRLTVGEADLRSDFPLVDATKVTARAHFSPFRDGCPLQLVSP
jgi:hypothetical protein